MAPPVRREGSPIGPGSKPASPVLLTLVFPIADLRGFADDGLGRLDRPDWRHPDTYRDFVRSFGPVRERMLGGGNDYLREGYFCDAHNALAPISRVRKPRSDWRAGLLRSLFRLYSDGSALTKLEIGAILGRKARDARNPRPVENLGRAMLKHETRIPRHSENGTHCLFESGNPFAAFYQRQSTTTSYSLDLDGDPDQRLVRAGAPMLMAHVNAREQHVLPPDSHRLDLGSKASHQLFHSRVRIRGRTVRMWTLVGVQDYWADQTRLLRMYLIRLYTEHEVLRTVLRNLKNPRILECGEPARDRLQTYLNTATRRIGRMAQKSSNIVGHEMGTLAREAEDTIRPGDIAMLTKSIEALGIRREISHKAQKYMQQDAVVYVSVQEGGVFSMTNETHNQNVNYGTQGNVQQAGAGATQTAHSTQTAGEPQDLASALAALKDLVSTMQGELPPADAAVVGKTVAHLGVELETPGVEPDKGAVLKALEKIGGIAEKAEKYVDPIGKIVKLVRKFAGF